MIKQKFKKYLSFALKRVFREEIEKDMVLKAKNLAFKNNKLKINWLPYVLEIPDFLGSAKVDDQGNVIESNRNDHQWRRVKYSYMDCRRHANMRNIIVRGPQKIWNTQLISRRPARRLALQRWL